MKLLKWFMIVPAIINFILAAICLFLGDVDSSRHSTIIAFLCIILANQFYQNER